MNGEKYIIETLYFMSPFYVLDIETFRKGGYFRQLALVGLNLVPVYMRINDCNPRWIVAGRGEGDCNNLCGDQIGREGKQAWKLQMCVAGKLLARLHRELSALQS
jgi:hypothetical protein